MKKNLLEKTWFIILMVFVVPPFAIYLIWSKRKNLNKIIKTVLTIVLGWFSLIWLLVVIGVFAGGADTDSSVSLTDTSIAVTTSAPTEERTTKEEISETVTETTTEEILTVENTETESTKMVVFTTEKKSAPTTKATTQRHTEKETEKVTKPTTTQNPEEKITVYITKTGKKYHYENPCGNGTYYPVSLADAKELGLTPCEKCVLH